MRQLAEKYISNVEGQLSKNQIPDVAVVKHVRDYLADSRHYLSKGEYLTALVCASYAEGVIDGSFIETQRIPSWESESKKVLVVGTWDLLHPGHISFLWEAKKLGKVYVIVARDANVTKSKGRPPIIPESQRAEVLRNLKPVDYVVIGDESDFLKPVSEIRPDIILLGPDEKYPEDKLSKELAQRGLNPKIIRISERFNTFPLNSTTEIIRKVIGIYCPEVPDNGST